MKQNNQVPLSFKISACIALSALALLAITFLVDIWIDGYSDIFGKLYGSLFYLFGLGAISAVAIAKFD